MRSNQLKRVNRFLKRSYKRNHWELCAGVTDPRDRRGRRWSLRALVGAAFAGRLVAARSLRAVEDHSALMAGLGQHGFGYIVGLKQNQPELYREAERHFQLRTEPLGKRPPEAPEVETGWERYQGRRIKRQLWRTAELAGWNGWDHLRQVWLVRQLTQHKDGRIEVEDHYRLTNLVWGRLKGTEILAVVRAHWGIENCANWTTDVQWDEDQRAWCYQGNALLVLGLLRLMAFNVLQVLFKRHLKAKRHRTLRWEQRFRRVELALLLPRAVPKRG